MLMLYCQKPDQSNDDFKEEFEALWSTFEQQGGNMWKGSLVDAKAAEVAAEAGHPQPEADDIATAEALVEDEVKAALMLSAADNKRFSDSGLKNYLENRNAVNHSDEYPTDTTRLLSQMNNFRVDSAPGRQRTKPSDVDDGDSNGVNFAQEGKEGDANDASDVQQGTNFLQGWGHGRPKTYTQATGAGTTKPETNKSTKDKAKKKAKEQKQVVPQGAPPSSCMHIAEATTP